MQQDIITIIIIRRRRTFIKRHKSRDIHSDYRIYIMYYRQQKKTVKTKTKTERQRDSNTHRDRNRETYIYIAACIAWEEENPASE